MKILFPAVVVTLLFFNAPAVDACSCGRYPTACESYRGADAVFIGVVQHVETKKAKAGDGREFGVAQTANVQVEKSFKGVAQPELVFRSGGSSCDAVYKEGQRWLFYAYYNKDTKLIRAQGNKSDVGTKPIPLETGDMQDIKLTFPFPSCKRPKEKN